MAKDVDVLHHIGLIAKDMTALIVRYEQLGFRFTPLSMPQVPLRPGGGPEPLGVGNRCAIFEDNYLEVLGVIDAERWNSITPAQRGPFDIDVPLSRYEGLHVMHFGADDLEVVATRFAADATAASEIRPFQRMVETEAGPALMRAQCISFGPGTNPEALIQMAQHLTPELVLQPRYMAHPNGVTAIRAVLVCSEAPAELARKYERYTGQPSRERGGDHVVELERSRVLVTSREGITKWIPRYSPPVLPMLVGFIVEADLAATERTLRASGVPFESRTLEDGSRGFLVRPEDACGSAVIFAGKAT